MFPQRRGTTLRREQACIHPPRQDLHVLKTDGLQLFGQFCRGYQGLRAQVMKVPQIGHDRCCQPTDVIMAAVLLEIGVEASRDRNAQLPCRAQGRIAQWTLGHDVNEIGPCLLPLLQDGSPRGPAALQLRITGNFESR